MKSAFIGIGVFLLVFIIMIFVGELYIRQKLPRYSSALVHATCQRDPVIGWVNKKVAINIPSFSSHRQTIAITHKDDGRRITSASQTPIPENNPQIIIVGGSLSYGYGLSDEETWPWLLQRKLSSYKVLNYSTPGYGTYQALLMLERVLPKLSSPKIVIYGFLEHHLVRNVAPPSWRALLNRDRRKTVCIPYVDVDQDGNIIRHPPVSSCPWPLSKSLAIVKFAEIMFWTNFQGREYFQEMDIAWQHIMVEMRDLCARYECRLIVAVLHIAHQTEKNFYTDFLALHNIKGIDCDLPSSEALKLEKDPNHPNHKANEIWAHIIGKTIVNRNFSGYRSYQQSQTPHQ